MQSLLARRLILTLAILIGTSSFLPTIARAEAMEATESTATPAVVTEPVAIEPVVAEPVVISEPTVVSEPTVTVPEPTVAEPVVAGPVAEPVVSEPAVSEIPEIVPTVSAPAIEPAPAESVVPTNDEEQIGVEAEKDFTNIVRQTTDYTCGPAALATLILLKGGEAQELELAQLAGSTEAKGTSMLGLKRAATELGYQAKVKRWNLERLKAAELPVLIHDTKADSTAHYSVVKGFTATTVLLADTEVGNLELSLADFEKVYTGRVLTIKPMETVQDGMSLDAVANVLEANPELGAIAFDKKGNIIPVDQLDDINDQEAESIHGRGDTTTLTIQLSQLPLNLRMALAGAGFGGTAITVLATLSTGEIVGIIGAAAFGTWLINWLFDQIDVMVKKLVKKLQKVKAAERAATRPAPEDGGKCGPNGGTYMLLDAVGKVMYVGRTDDLGRREAEHAKNPDKSKLRFKVDKMTNNCDAQRGREQILWEKHNPPLNKIRPIRQDNPNLKRYMDAGRKL